MMLVKNSEFPASAEMSPIVVDQSLPEMSPSSSATSESPTEMNESSSEVSTIELSNELSNESSPSSLPKGASPADSEIQNPPQTSTNHPEEKDPKDVEYAPTAAVKHHPGFKRKMDGNSSEVLEKFYCDICLKPFEHEYNSKGHVYTHMNRNELEKTTIYYEDCDFCGKIFLNGRSYMKHIKIHQGQPAPEVLEEDINDAQKSSSTANSPDPANHVQESNSMLFLSEVSNELENDQISAHIPAAPPPQGAEESTNDAQESTSPVPPTTAATNESRIADIIKSISTLTQAKPVRRRKKRKFSLLPKKRLQFKCYFCSRYFCFLDVHLVTHTQEKPFKCLQCKKEYTQQSSLTTHERTHGAGGDRKLPFSPSRSIRKARINYKNVQLNKKHEACNNEGANKTSTDATTLTKEPENSKISIQEPSPSGITNSNEKSAERQLGSEFKVERDSRTVLNEYMNNSQNSTSTPKPIASLAQDFVNDVQESYPKLYPPPTPKLSEGKINALPELPPIYEVVDESTNDAQSSVSFLQTLASSKKNQNDKTIHIALKLNSPHPEKHINPTKKSTFLSVSRLTRFCYFCGKHFGAPSRLNRHLLTHIKETPFKCSKCGQEFTQQSSVVWHQKLHMKDDDKRLIHCSFCPMQFTQKKSKIRHEKSMHFDSKDDKHRREVVLKLAKVPDHFDSDEKIAHKKRSKAQKSTWTQRYATIHTDRQSDSTLPSILKIAETHPYITHDEPPLLIAEQCEMYETTPKSNQRASPELNLSTDTTERPSENPLQCQEDFAEQCSLTTPEKTETDGGRKFRCFLCPLEFTERADSIKHQKIHFNRRQVDWENNAGPHPQRESENNENSSSEESPPESVVEGPGNDLDDPESMSIELPTPEAAADDKIGSQKSSLTRSKSVNQRKTLFRQDLRRNKSKCYFCMKYFSSRDRHYAVHTTEKPFKCSNCKQEFSQRGSLTRHAKIHGVVGDRNLFCASKSTVKSNREKIHSNEKELQAPGDYAVVEPLEAPTGPEAGLGNHEINAHQSIVSACNTLIKSETQNCSSTIHETFRSGKILKSSTMTSPLRQIGRTSTLALDKTNKNPQCYFCGKSWKYEQSVNSHMVTHTKEAPFKCPQCKKEFTQKGSLKMHEETHGADGGRKFPCSYCPSKFTQKISRINHEKKVHPLGNKGDNRIVHTRINRKKAFKHPDKTHKPQNEHKNSEGMSTLRRHVKKVCKIVSNAKPLKPQNKPRNATRMSTLRHQAKKIVKLPKVSNVKCLKNRANARGMSTLRPHMKEDFKQPEMVPDVKPLLIQNKAKTAKVRSTLRHKKKLSKHPKSSNVKTETLEPPKKPTSAKGLSTLRHPQGRHFCYFCGQDFLVSFHLINHLRTHTGETPFKCNRLGCKKEFKIDTDLFRHINYHL